MRAIRGFYGHQDKSFSKSLLCKICSLDLMAFSYLNELFSEQSNLDITNILLQEFPQTKIYLVNMHKIKE